MGQEALTLGGIESQVDERITSLIANPVAPRSHQPVLRVVAGIDVVDREARDSAMDRFIGELKAYQVDAAALKTALDAAGVSYLAILPTKSWEGMCSDAGLYRFAPDPNGRVRASNAVLDNIEAKMKQKLRKRPLVALAMGAVLSAAVTLYLTASLGWGWQAFAAVLAAVAGGYALSALVNRRYFTGEHINPDVLAAMESEEVRKRLATHASTLEALWPDGTEDEAGFRLKIRVPPAPEDAQVNLARAHAAGLPLALAVVGEAISFDEDPVGRLLEQRGDRYAQIAEAIVQDRARARAARQRRIDEAMEFLRDPIVTTDHGRATAVIVQYGEFPIEQAVVDRMLAEQLA